MGPQSLAGRVALVTGANHGIGAATAVALAECGADVAVAFLRFDARDEETKQPPDYARQRGQDASSTIAALDARGVRSLAVEADLADPHTPARLLDEVERSLGPVSVLVHNASGWRADTFMPAGDADAVTTATFTPQFDVDVRAGALLIAAFARRHRARGADWGRIVTLSSGGPKGFPGEVSYGAAKAALENYTMSAATELAPFGITANVVHPPVTDTGWITDDVRRLVVDSTELVHIAEPAEVAAVIAWLCADDARLVSGNILRLR
jgi:3-oxoacyl-[acyl-carrier protein] reductase